MTDSETPVDILVLGATGFTGRLIAQYLAAHPARRTFSLALGARSHARLAEVAAEVAANSGGAPLALVVVDVTQPQQVDAAVRGARVIINAVGPYWRWGKDVVKACALHGRHYVDLAGEPAFMQYVISRYDYIASKTGAIIIPAAGQDSVPSDLAVHLSARALAAAVPGARIASSTTAFQIKGGISGGTIGTAFAMLEEVPDEVRRASTLDYALSPAITGLPYPRPRLTYELPYAVPRQVGGYFFMAPVNRLVVQRTWGLLELAARTTSASTPAGGAKAPAPRDAPPYGANFVYDEFLVLPNRLFGALFTAAVGIVGLGILFAPIRWLAKKFLPSPGSGPSESTRLNGRLVATNVTVSEPDAAGHRTVVKSFMRGRGDPGYFLTSIMISEAALALALQHDALPALGRAGGVLTPASALGDVLVERLRATGAFEFDSGVLAPKKGVGSGIW